jgi:DNA-binding CsgD family transcriptional regulator
MCLVESVLACRGVALTQAFTFDCDWRRVRNISDDWLATHSRLRHLDPSAELLDAQPLGTPYFVQSDTPSHLKGTELHDSLPVHGFTDVAIARLYSPFRSDLTVALYRFDGAPAFTEPDRERLRVVLAAVSRGLASKRALAALAAARGETVDEALPRLAGHVFLSMPAGALSWSASAKRLLTTRLGLDAASLPRAERMVRDAAYRFLSAVDGARSQPIPGGLRVEFAVIPPRPGETQRLLGWFVDDRRSDPGPVPADALLSPRQRRIARDAAAGDSLTTIATKLKVRPETVRSHLREIYRRLGVQRRVELARLFTRPG